MTLLSRSAEAAFWMARYMERVESLARIIDVTETFTNSDFDDRNWGVIVQLNSDERRFRAVHDRTDGGTVVDFYALDRGNPTSIASAIAAARENARTLRPLISTEMWSQINALNRWIGSLKPRDLQHDKLARFCADVKENCQAHTGIIEGTYYRDQGWYFYQIGKNLERADQTTRLIDIKYHSLLPSPQDVGGAIDEAEWNALLRSAAGYHAYRRVYPRGMQPAKVADFLLFDEGFPRSLNVCTQAMNVFLTRLKSRYALAGGNQALERLDEIAAMLAGHDVDSVIGTGLHEFLDFLQRQLIRLSNDLGADFFGYPPIADAG
ncbi:MAG: alpha-E domain-containing protein [Inquilinus sp.]|nr:alpha-E domain-containing protein [Inquilinus sp.]